MGAAGRSDELLRISTCVCWYHRNFGAQLHRGYATAGVLAYVVHAYLIAMHFVHALNVLLASFDQVSNQAVSSPTVRRIADFITDAETCSCCVSNPLAPPPSSACIQCDTLRANLVLGQLAITHSMW